MSQKSKSPKKMVRTALRVAARVLPEYSHHMSPKKFTQRQLFACLILKMFFKTDYRGICTYLADMPHLYVVSKNETKSSFIKRDFKVL
jgi:hypothetical protein